VKKLIPQKIKNIYHFFQAVLANIWFGWPGKKIKIIGVTGTNGKTTTVQMIAKILEESGARVAMASTINFKIGEKEWVNKTKFTTLNVWKTLDFIKKSLRENCEYLVLEVGSHALDQFRVWGIKFDIAVVTNVTREHLDYHKSMEQYRKAKLKLFKKARVAVVNLDMEKPEDFLQFGNAKKYGYEICHPRVSRDLVFDAKALDSGSGAGMTVVAAENLELETNDTRYQMLGTKYLLNIPGLFNVENALAATCVGMEYGVSQEKIKEALLKIKNVPGRLESVPNDLGIKIVIDYAVTPDSLEKLYGYISQIKSNLPLEKGDLPAGRQGVRRTEGFEKLDMSFKSSSSSSFSKGGEPRIIAVFGSCGERDRGKRPIMGSIVDKVADYIILTNEDPYGEEPWQIINEVADGLKNKEENKNFWKIMDRREAIAKALKLARMNDIVVVTGKGAEENMMIGNKKIPWNDKKVIQEELGKIKLAL